MNLKPLPFRASLNEYEKQAEGLLAAFRSGDPQAIRCFKERHPRFLDPKIPWLPKDFSDDEIRSVALELADAQLALARWYDFRDWPALTDYVEAVTRTDSPVCRFESAVEAVINGDLTALKTLLREHPELVRDRSTRVTHFDPPMHRATLFHYVAANGVEGYRQRSPKNAVEVAQTLLEAGAEVDALADMYGGQWATMGLLVSSCHPAEAGVQIGLVNTLIDFGAALEPKGMGKWGSPLMTALVFGYQDAAETLVKRGARADNLALTAGLGRLTDARRLLPQADGITRQRALALAAQLGHADVVGLLLDAGENPDRYNPDGLHAHTTPLHLAVLHGHVAVVKLLVERGARLDIKDTIYQSTPLGWAEHAGHREVADFLRSKSSEAANAVRSLTPIRVVLPFHLRNLARVDGEVQLEVASPVTVSAVLDALEARFPMLRGTIRDHGTLKRRPFIRFFACKEDLSLESPDTILPDEIVKGVEPFLIVGAMAGG